MGIIQKVNENELNINDITLALEAEVGRAYLSEAEMPYHGQDHPFEVRDTALKIAGLVKEQGVDVDEATLVWSALLHDALSHINPAVFGFDTAEALAGTYTYNLLKLLGVSEELAEKTKSQVLATNAFVEPKTVEEKILRAADLSGVSGEFSDFHKGTLALHAEAEFRRGESYPYTDFVRNQYKYLKYYIAPFIELTGNARTSVGGSAWHVNALQNIEKQMKMVLATDERPLHVVAEIFSEKRDELFQSSASERSETLYLGLADSDELRADLLATFDAKNDEHTAYFTVPGFEFGMSLPEQFCNEMVVDSVSPILLSEVRRTLRKDGMLRVLNTEMTEDVMALLDEYHFRPLGVLDATNAFVHKSF